LNFLAHSYLSANNPEVLLGNFFADAVKGNHIDNFPPLVIRGIRLHRMIDSFTDSHPVFLESRHRIQENYGKFSGIIIDIFYDHFLAKDWERYSNKPLKTYSAYVYQLLINNFRMLPSRSKRILPFMVSQDWLSNYANFRGMERVFAGMDRRTGHISGMDHAVEDLKVHYEDIGNDFRQFFPEIIAFACHFLQEHDLSCEGVLL